MFKTCGLRLLGRGHGLRHSTLISRALSAETAAVEIPKGPVKIRLIMKPKPADWFKSLREQYGYSDHNTKYSLRFPDSWQQCPSLALFKEWKLESYKVKSKKFRESLSNIAMGSRPFDVIAEQPHLFRLSNPSHPDRLKALLRVASPGLNELHENLRNTYKTILVTRAALERRRHSYQWENDEHRLDRFARIQIAVGGHAERAVKELKAKFGQEPVGSFTAIGFEITEVLPADPEAGLPAGHRVVGEPMMFPGAEEFLDG